MEKEGREKKKEGKKIGRESLSFNFCHGKNL
jgi:hypothetical protein